MAAASFPSPALRSAHGERSYVRLIPPRIACLTIIAPSLEIWHHSRNRATIHLKNNDIPWRPLCASKSMSPPEFPHQNRHPPLSEVIHNFYSAINDKDLSVLDNLISDDCIFEDLAYFSPLERKRIQHFFKGLTEAMGRHVRFIIDHIYEGDELSIAVTWHLEWNNKFIPFTRGCSLYRCSRDGEEPLIKAARVFMESPLKPGDFAVKMLKAIISLFDTFPQQAESFLQKPDAIIHFIATIYRKFIEPLILSFLVYYTHLWAWITRVLSFVLNILQQILKRFI